MSNRINQQFWSRFWGILILSIGVLLLLQTLDFITWEFWEFVGPALLIICGIAIIRNPDSWCCCLPYRETSQPTNPSKQV